MVNETNPNTAPPETKEDVWTYRGYKIRPGEFNTAMIHFYRGEITRSNVWRTRLDNTTNWAVVATGAALSFTFGSVTNSHIVILINMLLLCVFLIIEARRYRYYELWALRVRLMETDFFAAMLTPPFAPHQEWAVRLANSLIAPEFPITVMEAVGRRLRRNYIWLFLILGLAWAMKLILHPVQIHTFDAFLRHAQIGFVPGSVVALLVVFFFVCIFLAALFTLNLQDSAGEVLSRHEALNLPTDFLQNIASAASQVLPDDLPFLHRREHLAIIITDKAEAVSEQLLSLLKRGVTALEGKGMYSGAPRTVLLSAITPSEISRLKSLVYAIDEHAFVVVNPTEEVLGKGFGNLQPRWKQAKTGRSK